MQVVLGASGNTGHVVAQDLLSKGERVRVVGRNADHLQFLAAKGGEPFVADVTDPQALARAFQNADSAYVLIPPNPKSNNVRSFQDTVSDAVTKGLRDAGIKNVVLLSSIGADKASGTGPVVGLHNFEQKLNQLEGANVLHLRAGYFMENTLPQAAAIRLTGSTVGPLQADLKVSMIASRDIGKAAATAMLSRDFRGKQARELHGNRDLGYDDATAIIGNAIGKPDLKYIQAPDEQMLGAMVQMGMSEDMARQIIEMAGALNSGYMRPLEARTPESTTETTFEDFVAEFFVPAYQQQEAA
jgi:uncharacterized protein YbjT (DUF2867 family)